jgi:hypothetical protein
MKRFNGWAWPPRSPDWGAGGSALPPAHGPSAGATPQQWAQALAGIAGDLVLVLDEQGFLLAAAGAGAAIDGHPGAGWLPGWMAGRIGQAWVDQVLPESRAKVQAMLAELHRGDPVRQREIGHGTHDGHSVLMTCGAARLGEHGPWLVVGRDGSAEEARVRRLWAAQQAMEARYAALMRRLEGQGNEDGAAGTVN